MNAADALPDLPALVTVAVPGAAFAGTFVISENCPLVLAAAEPRAVFVPASVKLLATLSPTEKNWPKILNGAVP